MPRKTKAPDPPPESLAELYEALDALESAARELKKQKRALFPAINAHRRAVRRVREVWRSARGLPSADPARPLLDAMAAAQAPAAEVVAEQLPDGGAARKPADPTLKRLRGKAAYDSAREVFDGAAALPERAPTRRIKGRVTRSGRPAEAEA